MNMFTFYYMKINTSLYDYVKQYRVNISNKDAIME